MKRYFSGTFRLIRFTLRKERVVSAIWLAALTGITVIVAAAFSGLLSDIESTQRLAALFQSPATIAMIGPLFGDSFGGIFAASMLLFTALAAGVMNIFFAVRHTRGDEEKGRAEVVRSLPVGRLSNLSAVMAVAVLINLALALAVGLSLAAAGLALSLEGVSFGGSMLYGFTLGIIGLFFAAAAALFAQISPSAQGATGLSMALLGLLYIARMGGDVKLEALSKATPLGMILRTECFVGNKVWPLFALTGISAAFAAPAFYLNSVRDMERGLLPERRGRREASVMLKRPIGLAFRLVRNAVAAWAASLLLLGISYGSVMDQMPGFIADLGLNISTEQFIGLIFAVLSAVSAIPAAGAVLRLANEEKSRRYENIFSKAVSRSRILTGYLIIAFIESFVMLFCMMIGMWAASAAVMETPMSFGATFASVMIYLPAVWLMIGIAALLTGIIPQKAGVITYSYLGFTGFMIYIGGMLSLPEFTKYLTPFGYIPQLTAGTKITVSEILLIGALIAAAALLTAAGYFFYRKRDIT